MDWKKLLEEFVSKLNEATKDKSDDEKKKLIDEATAALPQDVRQHLHDAGHASGSGAAEADKKKLEQERDAAKVEATKKAQEVEALTKQLAEKQPDLAKQKAEYEELLATKEREKTEAVQKAQQEAEAVRRSAVADRLLARYAPRLTDDGQAYARTMAGSPEILKRIALGDDGALKVYQADGKTPAAVPSGTDPLDFLAGELAQATPKALLRSSADGGSGVGSGEGGPSASEFDAVTKAVEQQYAGGNTDDARKRLGW